MATVQFTVYSINGVTPVVDPEAFVHPTAVLIGDVIVRAGCYVGPAACLRGDFGHIELREGANVQAKLPFLSTYLGHVDLAATQRYLTILPETKLAASERFRRYGGGLIAATGKHHARA